MSNTFNLQIEMEMLEKQITFQNNEYKSGSYTIRFLPSLTYTYQGYERILDKLVYEVGTARGTCKSDVRTIKFKILRENCNPVLLDDVKIKGIELEALKNTVEDFVKSMEAVIHPEL